MDLYEALKQGLTEEELLKNFNKELTEAKEKLSKEEEHSHHLKIAKQNLINSVLDYVEIITIPFENKKEREENYKAIEQIIEEYEKLNFTDFAKNFFSFKFAKSDDDIINSFIKSLK